MSHLLGICSRLLDGRARAFFVSGVCLLGLAACSAIPKDGPTGLEVRENAHTTIEDADRLGYAFVKLSALTLKAFHAAPAPPAVFSGRVRRQSSADVRVGPSDTISISIFEAGSGGLYIPSEAGVRPGNFIQIPTQELDRRGYISVPYGGLIKALGQTPRQIEQAIVAQVKNRAIEPQVMVTISERSSNGVSVLGDVKDPKLIPLKPGGMRLLAAIASAGGPTLRPSDTVINLQRRGRTERAVFSTILRDPSHNIQLEPNDVIYALARERTYMIFGATPTQTSISTGAIVQQGRKIPFDGDRMTLAGGLAKAGGLLSERADPKAVFLFRIVPRALLQNAGVDVSTFDTRDIPTVFTVDLSNAEGFLIANQFEMKHDDIIFVADAPANDLFKFLAIIDGISGTTRGVVSTATAIKDFGR